MNAASFYYPDEQAPYYEPEAGPPANLAWQDRLYDDLFQGRCAKHPLRLVKKSRANAATKPAPKPAALLIMHPTARPKPVVKKGIEDIYEDALIRFDILLQRAGVNLDEAQRARLRPDMLSIYHSLENYLGIKKTKPKRRLVAPQPQLFDD